VNVDVRAQLAGDRGRGAQRNDMKEKPIGKIKSRQGRLERFEMQGPATAKRSTNSTRLRRVAKQCKL